MSITPSFSKFKLLKNCFSNLEHLVKLDLQSNSISNLKFNQFAGLEKSLKDYSSVLFKIWSFFKIIFYFLFSSILACSLASAKSNAAFNVIFSACN